MNKFKSYIELIQNEHYQLITKRQTPYWKEKQKAESQQQKQELEQNYMRKKLNYQFGTTKRNYREKNYEIRK